MRLEEMNLSNIDKWISTSYGKTGFYKNTDEAGLVEIFYVNVTTGLIQCLSTDYSDFEFFESFSKEPIKLEAIQSSGISEDFVIRLLKVFRK